MNCYKQQNKMTKQTNSEEDLKSKEMLKFVLKNIFENTDSRWILQIEEDYVSNRGILTILGKYHEERYAKPTRFLNQFADALSPKKFIGLAWAWIGPKGRQPYVENVYYKTEAEKYSFLLDRYAKQMQIGGHDMKYAKKFLLESIKENTVEWFLYYGIEESVWNKMGLDYKLATGNAYAEVKKEKVQGLAVWGLI
jgi:hypothetical protein